MKILFITVRSDFGGGPRHVNQLIKELPKECEVFIAYPEEGDPYAEFWKKDKRIKKNLFIPYRKFSIKALFALKKFVKDNGIDIIHSHGNGAGLYSRLLRLLGVEAKVIHTFHGISDEYSSRIKFMISIAVGWLLEPMADKYIAVSNGEKNLGIKWGFCKDENCQVIYNGIEDEGLGLKNYKKREIVTISRYDYQKNMSLCLDIVRLMKDDDVKFVWVGDGEDFAAIKKIVDNEKLPVNMVGFQIKPIDFLKKATVYLSTSRFEGLPYALIESASVGLPIVATDVKGNNEVGKILNNEVEYYCMSENSRKMFEMYFAIEVMISKLIKLYLSLLEIKNSK